MPHIYNFWQFGSEPGHNVNHRRGVANIRQGYHVSFAVDGEYKIHGNEIKGVDPWHLEEAYSDLIESMNKIRIVKKDTSVQR
jgi:hypothetical protein